MNEDQAAALFAPARERTVPPADFAMADVFAADFRHRRQRRAAAVSGTVLVVVLAIVGFIALSGTGKPHAVTPEVTPTPTTHGLASVLDQVVVPPNALKVATDPTGTHAVYGSGLGFQQLDRYWTAQVTPLEAITAMTAHTPAGLVGPGRPTVATPGGRIDQYEQFDAPETATADGPHLLLDARALPSGLTALSAHLWQTTKPAKSVNDTVPDGVDSVIIDLQLYGSTNQPNVTLSGSQADELAEDVNALWVKLGPEPDSCGTDPAAATYIGLWFRTAGGDRNFGVDCDFVDPSVAVPGTGGHRLWASRALIAHLQADVGDQLVAPLKNFDWLQGPQPQAVAGPDDLTAILDHLTPPANAQQIPAPPDLQDGKYGYADQPGYQQAIRAWTTTLDPSAAIAALTQQPPAGMTGGVPPAGPGGKGPQEVDASYKTADTATRLGPQLELSAVENTPGTTTIEALAWQLDKTAKPVRDTVGGTVKSVTGAWSGRPAGSLDVTGAAAQHLADDVNALLINHSALPHGCGPATATLTLTFHTSAGDQAFADSCGFVRVLPSTAALPELQTSDPLNLDVNTLFASLLATPLPSSAPLPTPGGPGKNPDQIIGKAPATVSLFAFLPISKGKQQMTYQRFDLTGDRLQQMLADLRALKVDTGPTPDDCAEYGLGTAIVVTSRGKQVASFSTSALCPTVHSGTDNDPPLRATSALTRDVASDLDSLVARRSFKLRSRESLALTLRSAQTLDDKEGRPLDGTVTVTQDGATIATKHLVAGQIWHLPIQWEGVYSIAASSPGQTCATQQVLVSNDHEVEAFSTCSAS